MDHEIFQKKGEATAIIRSPVIKAVQLTALFVGGAL
jgi:hypothetical protein